MKKSFLLVLFFLAQCHLFNISASDLPDHLFPSGGTEYAKLDQYNTEGSYLNYEISVYHEHGIQKVVVSGAMSGAENSTVITEGVTSTTVKDTIALNADDNPGHTIYVTIYPMTGDTVVSSFTINAEIPDTYARLINYMISEDNHLSYSISVYHKHGIENINVYGSVSEIYNQVYS